MKRSTGGIAMPATATGNSTQLCSPLSASLSGKGGALGLFKKGSVANLGGLMKGMLRSEYLEFSLDYDGLSRRLMIVKKEFGMRKAVSTRSLTGETRTFAEMLDQEVEKVVLFYLRKQGEIARTLWYLRERAFTSLQGGPLHLEEIDEAGERYRDLCQEVVELLEYLELNVIGLRKILKKHDAQFDLKMTHMYFDARLGVSAKSNSQLVQLYHQEGLRAIIGTIRRAFEDLHEAREVLLAERNRRMLSSHSSDRDDIGYAFEFSEGPATFYASKNDSGRRRNNLPRMPFAERRASFSSGSLMNLPGSSSLNPVSRTRSIEKNLYSANSKSITDFEPSLKRIIDVADRVLKQQEQSSTDYIATHSTMALEMRVRALNKTEDEEDEEMDESLGLKRREKETSNIGLFLNLYIVFLYQANQYVVAPTSGQYSDMLGMSPAMSGVIIGLGPAAALVSALLFSAWSNYGFKRPLIFSLFCLTFGNFLYGSALQCKSPYMIFLGRLIAGFGGPRGLSRRYIADHVSLADRTIASSHFVTAGALGLAFGPLISSIVAQANYTFTWTVGGITVLQYEEVTAPGWIMFVLFLTCLFATHFLFKDPTMDVILAKPTSLFNFLFAAPKVLSKKGDKDYEPVKSNDDQDAPVYNVIIGVDEADFPQQAADMDVESQKSYELSKMQHMQGIQNLSPISMSPSKASLKKPESTDYLIDASSGTFSPSDIQGAMNAADKLSQGSRLQSNGGESDTNVLLSDNGIESGERQPSADSAGSGTSLMRKLIKTSIGMGPKDSLNAKHDQEGSLLSPKGIGSERYVGQGLGWNGNGYGSMDKYATSRGVKSTLGSVAGGNVHMNVSEGEEAGVSRSESGYKVLGSRHFTNGNHYSGFNKPHPALKAEREKWCWDYMTIEVAIILFVYFINKVGQEMVVSSAPTLTDSMFGWTAKINGFFMAGMGATVLPGSLLVSRIARGLEDRTMMNVLNWCCIITCLFMFDTTLFKYTIAQYITGSTLLFAFLNVLEGVIMSLLSKLVSPELARGTFNSGFLATEAGTLGRVIADTMITMISVSCDPVTLINWLYMPVAAGVLLCIIITFRYYETLAV